MLMIEFVLLLKSYFNVQLQLLHGVHTFTNKLNAIVVRQEMSRLEYGLGERGYCEPYNMT